MENLLIPCNDPLDTQYTSTSAGNDMKRKFVAAKESFQEYTKYFIFSLAICPDDGALPMI